MSERSEICVVALCLSVVSVKMVTGGDRFQTFQTFGQTVESTMACEDWPCCGHESGCCPDFDESGKQLNMRCVCGTELPVDSPMSICQTCWIRHLEHIEPDFDYVEPDFDYDSRYYE